MVAEEETRRTPSPIYCCEIAVQPEWTNLAEIFMVMKKYGTNTIYWCLSHPFVSDVARVSAAPELERMAGLDA